MPICSQSPTVLGSIKCAAEIDDHASEAAKVKRTREQAYFNSYNFDAIPSQLSSYNDIDNVDAGKRIAAEQSSKLGRSANALTHNNHNTLSSKYHNASLSSKSDCSSSVSGSGSHCNSNSNNSSRRSSAQSDGSAMDGFMRRGRARASDMNYAYLQRFGAALNVHPRQASPKQLAPTNATLSAADDVALHAMRSETDNGSFLLPRAMLKYQNVGNANSMPLAIISAAATTTTTTATAPATTAVHTTGRMDKLLQNGHNHSHTHSHSSSHNHNYSHNYGNNSNKTMMMTTNAGNSNSNNTATNATTNNNKYSNTHNNTTNNNSPSGNNSNSNSNATTNSNSNKSRQNYANNNDGYASLLIGADNDATLRVVAATAATTATSAATAATTAVTAAATPTPTSTSAATKVTSVPSRIKKQSTSSTITTTASSGSVEHELLPSQSVSARGDRSSRNATEPKSGQNSAAGERRGRTSSHQSHYSTDKSGSSGYYSSNVCSTYSLEDHIYCEPVIDILDVSGVKSKSANTIPQLLGNTTSEPVVEGAVLAANSRSRDMNGVAQGKRFGRRAAATGTKCGDDGDEACEEDDCEGDEAFKAESVRVRKSKRPSIPGMAARVDATGLQVLVRRNTCDLPTTQHFTENLRILETSIENLDRHLKNFPSLSSQERIASFVQSHHTYLQLPLGGDMGDRLARAHPHHHLPTIMEGYDPANQPRPWSDDIADDSLLDIDLDSFLLVNERKSGKTIKPLPNATHSGIDNPTFLTDELEENNYKCVKYINSCPDDAYRVESDIGAGTGTASEKSVSLTDHYMKRYEDQLHFQSTRELLEDVRDKIRLLSRANNAELHSRNADSPISHTPTEHLPKELENMIKTLKHELETYLDRMNQHSELEIRQLCSGLVKNQNIVKMKKAFERRRSTHSITESDYAYAGAYEAICDGVPASIREQIASIRCASDPNFKMKRKSLTEVFPTADCYIESQSRQSVLQDAQQHRSSLTRRDRDRDDNVITLHVPTTQLQRNLSFQQPILGKLGTITSPTDAEPTNGNKSSNNSNGSGNGNGTGATGGNGSGAESGESGDKDSILEWHRKKPSIWEMYYGTNRMNQSLLGKRNGVTTNNNSTQATMSYPSSRPESDFTLDLPRAEQLRIKMEKEKKFRQRCRYITTFLSLVFFLLTVMVVSLVLTRGKRMFGSMI